MALSKIGFQNYEDFIIFYKISCDNSIPILIRQKVCNNDISTRVCLYYPNVVSIQKFSFTKKTTFGRSW